MFIVAFMSVSIEHAIVLDIDEEEKNEKSERDEDENKQAVNRLSL